MMVLIGEMMGGKQIHHVLPKSRPTVIGKGEDADLRLDIHGLSRVHTQIELAVGQWLARDMDSTNGTYVNGQRIRSCALREGDIIQLGDATLRLFREEPEAEAAPAARRPLPKLTEKDTRAPLRQGPGCMSRIKTWCFRTVWWSLIIYCALSYYGYMTTMNEAIERRNEGVDMVDVQDYNGAVQAYEEARTMEQEARSSLFVKTTYSILPKKELSIDDDVAHAYFEKGNMLYNDTMQNRLPEALESYEKAFRLKPGMPDLAKKLSQLAFLQAKWDIALDASEEALKQVPNDPMLIKIKHTATRELNKK